MCKIASIIYCHILEVIWPTDVAKTIKISSAKSEQIKEFSHFVVIVLLFGNLKNAVWLDQNTTLGNMGLPNH